MLETIKSSCNEHYAIISSNVNDTICSVAYGPTREEAIYNAVIHTANVGNFALAWLHSHELPETARIILRNKIRKIEEDRFSIDIQL